jgi:hypothetical protein
VSILLADLPMSAILERLGETARAVKAPTLYPCGRQCERWGCITILSIYNEGPQCWVHRVDEFRPVRVSAA